MDGDHKGRGAPNRSPEKKRRACRKRVLGEGKRATSCRRRSEKQSEIDCAQLLESRERGCNASNGVARMRDDARGKMEPVVAETADGFALPLRAKVVALQELDEREGKEPNRKVETIGGELAAREVVEIVVMFQFADEPFHLSAPVVEVEHGLRIFFLDGNVSCDDPVVIVAVKEIGLLAATRAFDDQSERFGSVVHRVDGFRSVIVGLCAIRISPLFPGIL